MNSGRSRRGKLITALIVGSATIAFAIAPTSRAGDVLHPFDCQTLTDVYYSEGVNAGDINGDGVDDVVHGPYWFAGPAFTEKHEIYKPVPQNRDRYANNFFSWLYDFDKDGDNDIFVVGFPGTPAYVYENPGKEGHGSHWPKHTVFDSVSNESPHFIDIVGDERPELVCTRDGYFGYASVNWDKPFEAWTFHGISNQDAPKQFGHGLGVGDVNADGRQDLIMKDGWYEQPASLEGGGRWALHKATFAPAGGAEMYAYDVDGDGDSDIITSLQAHEFGLAWYEQLSPDEFKQHLIMGKKPEENRYGLVFTEPHSVALADIDGDGLKDIVTGKTYWSHHRQSPMWDAGAVVYWFRLVRGKDGVDWVPYLAAADSGIGRQVIVRDVNKDSLPDIVVGGMKGCSVLTHRRQEVSPEEWKAAQPKRYEEPKTSSTEPVTLENVVTPEANRGDEPIAAAFSSARAKHFLDSSAVSWQKTHKCMTCHTNYLYLMARPSFGGDDEAHQTVRKFAEELVEKRWEEKGPRWDAEVVMTALVLAADDASYSGQLHPLTRRALDRIWTVQHEDGGFEWLKCDWPPMESDDEFGAPMAALAVSVAPEGYAETPTAQQGIAKLRAYLTKTPPPMLHHRAMLLWADTYKPGWLTPADRQKVIDDLLALQHEDGSWSIAALGDWKREDGSPQDLKTGDGYATGLVVYLARRAGVPADDPRLARGVAWLKANQRESGRWFTRSLHKDGRHYISHAGTNMAVMALAACGELK